MRVSIKRFIVPSIPLAVVLVSSCFVLWMSAYVGARFSMLSTQNTAIVESLQLIFSPNSFLGNILCVTLTLLNAFLLTQINNRFTIIRTRTFLPIFIFLLLMSTWNQTHTLTGSHLALTLFILSLFYFFKMSRDKKASEQAFMGSFLIGISSLLINQLIFLIPVCWIGFMIFQSFSLRTFLASVFGVLAPWVLYLSGNYLLHPGIDLLQFFTIYRNLDSIYSTITLPELLYASSIIVIMIIAVIGMYSITHSDAIHTRNKLNFMVFLLISLSILSLVFQDQFISFLPFIALVYAILISHPLTLKQNNFYGILFIIFCILNIAFVISKYIIA